MNRRWAPTALLVLFTGFAGPVHAATVRALFVGIDHYQYSRAQRADALFDDLQGAAGDAGRIKAALRSIYGLGLDAPDLPAAPTCSSANGVSITLVDRCADRKSILAALDQQIRASAPGDTLLFYFAGHGSRYVDDQVLDQASGYESTILPYDARKPGAILSSDIMGRELYAIINAANARGVNVVTVFDSCDSGTATRDIFSEGHNRSAPPLHQAASGTKAPPIGDGAQHPGYRVHLAAAEDGEEAQEVPAPGGSPGTAGVFTSALIAALAHLPNASFADIANEAQLSVEESGHAAQHPHAEGKLQSSLGGASVSVSLLDATPSAGGATLQGGQLSGVTAGSVYALYASTSDAVGNSAAPLARGQITSVDASLATLSLDGPAAKPLPARLVARETAHAFGSQVLAVRIQIPSSDSRDLIGRTLKNLPFVRVSEPAQFAIGPRTAGSNSVDLYEVDGHRIATLGTTTDPAFAGRLTDALGKLARVRALLALRSPDKADSLTCIAARPYDACPPLATQARHLAVNQVAQLMVINTSDQPRFIYVLGITDDSGITLLLPPDDGINQALGPQQPLKRDDVQLDSPGRYRFLTIATDAPINAIALEQDSAGTRALGSCRTVLERLLCAASGGTRDLSAPKVGAWTATVVTAVAQ